MDRFQLHRRCFRSSESSTSAFRSEFRIKIATSGPAHLLTNNKLQLSSFRCLDPFTYMYLSLFLSVFSFLLLFSLWSFDHSIVCLSAWKSACLSDCPPVLLVCHSQSQNSINNYNAKCLFIIRLPVPKEFSCFLKSALLISHAKPLPCSVTLSFLISASVCQSDSNFSLSKSSSVSVYLPAFVFVILSLLLSVSLILISLSVCFLC